MGENWLGAEIAIARLHQGWFFEGRSAQSLEGSLFMDFDAILLIKKK
jgi:hypothetical protein